MRVLSPCKINLHLGILGKRNDGYHNLESFFLEVPWYDVIDIESNDSGLIVMKTVGIDLGNEEDNICFKAARLLKNIYNVEKGCTISLKKNIPVGAGLGGGSSNAASTLKSLISLWNIDIEKSETIDLAKRLGADVPFFMMGGLCHVKGIGDILTRVENKIFDYYLLIIYDNIHVSTPWAYKNLKKELTIENKCTKFDTVVLRGLDIDVLNEFRNDFEETVFESYPELANIKKDLYDNGACFSLMSGSGSSVFGIFKDSRNAIEAMRKADERGAVTKLVKI
ncbi:MAG: 4-(cytidine 5'-diphospho)-2-C-methyl-D-erythritol kinase [Candidatus Delongbacteria bacterium]|nr:4-(cytidine 5'-diphospho)-2-C-methyl-D-erythritol kinase [Candidatus Delongbacteria bacterium]MBN2835024.1 4-(cytidine 5'-diphospho)-2-C-methyl-D-erythritol kinase [Candidatus Delongbacteria bacterium]